MKNINNKSPYYAMPFRRSAKMCKNKTSNERTMADTTTEKRKQEKNDAEAIYMRSQEKRCKSRTPQTPFHVNKESNSIYPKNQQQTNSGKKILKQTRSKWYRRTPSMFIFSSDSEWSNMNLNKWWLSHMKLKSNNKQ